MSLSSFSAFALTRVEMKNVVGGYGAYGCSCSAKNSDGQQISFEYTTYGNSSKSCQAPSSGSAYYSYSRNGRNYSGYIDSSSAADLCGYSTTQATYVVN